MNKASTYYFIGQLEPYERCKDFSPGELALGDGWVLDIFLSAKNIIGAYVGDKVSKYAEPRRNARANTHGKKAAWIFPKMMSNQFVRLALKDYMSALRDSSDDAFFYAYRSVENVCRFVSGAQDEFKPSHWAKMHKELGTTKKYIDPLLNVAIDIRHGHFDSSSSTSDVIKRSLAVHQFVALARRLARFKRALSALRTTIKESL